MKRFQWKAALLACLLPLSAFAAADPALVGRWDKDGAPCAELKADGSGQSRGAALSWQTQGKALLLNYADGRQEMMFYKVDGKNLTIAADGQLMAFTRGSGSVAAPVARLME